MFVCEKNSSCCNYQYADRLNQIDEEFRNCGNLIEVVPLRHGSIVKTERRYPYCSVCNTSLERTYFRFCPYCGVKFDEENNNG